MIVGMS